MPPSVLTSRTEHAASSVAMHWNSFSRIFTILFITQKSYVLFSTLIKDKVEIHYCPHAYTTNCDIMQQEGHSTKHWGAKETNQVCPKEEQERNGARHVPATKYEQIFVTLAAMQPLLLPSSPETPLPLPKGICPTLLTQTSPPSPSRLLPSLHIVLLVLVPEHWIQSLKSTGKAHYHLSCILGPLSYLKWGHTKFPMLPWTRPGRLWNYNLSPSASHTVGFITLYYQAWLSHGS